MGYFYHGGYTDYYFPEITPRTPYFSDALRQNAPPEPFASLTRGPEVVRDCHEVAKKQGRLCRPLVGVTRNCASLRDPHA